MEFKSTSDLIEAFPDEMACIEYLEKVRWLGEVVSPFDETSKVYRTARGYKCKNTGKYFNAKTGTVLEDTKVPLIKWFTAIFLFSNYNKQITIQQLMKHIDVTQKTAWSMLYRLKYTFNTPEFKEALEDIG